MRCSECQDDPVAKIATGCEQPTQTAVWETNEGDEVYSCPITWITPDILDWYAEYKYYEQFGGAPLYECMPNLWIEAWLYYSHCKDAYLAQKMKTEDRTSKSLRELEEGYHGR